MFKKLHINIPFMEALEKMPNCIKFMKEVMLKKMRLEEFEIENLTEECSAILQRNFSKKLKDLGSFTIPDIIDNSSFDKALCDLETSINLMPLSVFKKLRFGEVKPSIIYLQLANRSLTYPWGVIKDALVKVDKFIFPADFVVLDMEEDPDVFLIFGRPFLAIGGALIYVQSGGLTLRVNGEEVNFRIYRSMKPNDEKSHLPSGREYWGSCNEYTARP